MKLSNLIFFLGLISVPLSIAAWVAAPDIAASPYTEITDVAIKNAFAQAHAERWGIFVGLWAPTLISLSIALRQRAKISV